MLKSASILFAGNICLAVFNLIRSILVARLLTVEEFGIASTFNILLAMMTMAFGLNLGQLLIQAPDGEARRFQGTLQVIQIGMGLTIAGAMVMGAGLYADLMTVPEAVWGFQLMALLAFSQGFLHLDVYRQQRAMRFTPFVLHTTGGVVLSTLAVYPLYLVFGDWRVMLYTLLIQQLLAFAFSHLTAERSYRLAWDGAVARRALLFSAPLLLNGVFLLGISQGERLIVANRFGLEELAWFSVGFMLTMLPVSLIAKSLHTLFLPVLSRHQGDPAAFGLTAIVACQAVLVLGLALALGFALFGPAVIWFLYGERYMPAAALVVLLAVMQGVRTAQTGTVVAALARARSGFALYITVARFAFIARARAAVRYGGGDILALVLIGIAGERAALMLAYAILRGPLGVGLRRLGPALGVVGAALLAITWQGGSAPVPAGPWAGLHAGQLVPLGLTLLVPLAMPALRRALTARLAGRGWAEAAQ